MVLQIFYYFTSFGFSPIKIWLFFVCSRFWWHVHCLTCLCEWHNLIGANISLIRSLQSLLNNQFRLKELGNLKYFLGIEIARSTRGISLSQRHYTVTLLEDTGLLGCRPNTVPMIPHFAFVLLIVSPFMIHLFIEELWDNYYILSYLDRTLHLQYTCWVRLFLNHVNLTLMLHIICFNILRGLGPRDFYIDFSFFSALCFCRCLLGFLSGYSSFDHWFLCISWRILSILEIEEADNYFSFICWGRV